MGRVELEFPLQWEYKIIATRCDEVFNSLCQAIRACGFSEQPYAGNISKNGSYVTYTVSMQVENQEQLERLTYALGQCSGVKYLL